MRRGLVFRLRLDLFNICWQIFPTVTRFVEWTRANLEIFLETNRQLHHVYFTPSSTILASGDIRSRTPWMSSTSISEKFFDGNDVWPNIRGALSPAEMLNLLVCMSTFSLFLFRLGDGQIRQELVTSRVRSIYPSRPSILSTSSSSTSSFWSTYYLNLMVRSVLCCYSHKICLIEKFIKLGTTHWPVLVCYSIPPVSNVTSTLFSPQRSRNVKPKVDYSLKISPG